MSDYLYLFGSLILVTLSQLLLKKGVGKVDKSGIDGIIRIIFQKHVLLGLFLNALAAILWLLALSSFDLSYIFPFRVVFLVDFTIVCIKFKVQQ